MTSIDKRVNLRYNFESFLRQYFLVIIKTIKIYNYMNKKNSKIKLSVVIPAYNEEKFLPMCLESLKKQEIDVNYEVIVVDNNSTDNTAKMAKKYGARVLYEPQKGVCSARQAGSLLARGDIIVSTDADCIFPSNWLKNINQTFQENPQVVTVTGPFQYDKKPFWGKVYSYLLFKIVKYFYLKRKLVVHAAASNSAFRKNAWEDIGGYNTHLTQGGDELDVLKRLKRKGEIRYLPENKVLTSSRRLKKGFIYTVFITIIYYYFLDYQVASKITGKSMAGSYPAYRDEKQKYHWFNSMTYILLFVFLSLSFILGTGKVYSKNRVITGSHKVMAASKDGLIDVNEGRKNLKNPWYNYNRNHHSKDVN